MKLEDYYAYFLQTFPISFSNLLSDEFARHAGQSASRSAD